MSILLKREVLSLLFILALILPQSCSAPGLGLGTELGKRAILHAVKQKLTNEECGQAIELINVLYESDETDNEVRMLKAASHACDIGINFFSLLSDLSSANLTGTEFYRRMTEFFPSTTEDTRLESSQLATDALVAALQVGAILHSGNTINSGTYNEGVTDVGSRIVDANSYLIFIAMASMGTAQNRFGNPDVNYDKQQNLPWGTYLTMNATGCHYASSFIHLMDTIDEVSESLSGSLSENLTTIYDNFNPVVEAACVNGCNGNDWDGTPGLDLECTNATTGCTTCPSELRDRNSCTTNQTAACAAAGIVRMVNSDPFFGWN